MTSKPNLSEHLTCGKHGKINPTQVVVKVVKERRPGCRKSHRTIHQCRLCNNDFRRKRYERKKLSRPAKVVQPRLCKRCGVRPVRKKGLTICEECNTERLNRPRQTRQQQIDRIVKRQKERYHSNPLYRLTKRCRNLLGKYVRGKQGRSRTFTYIGCGPSELKQWLEDQFSKRMSWDNYGYAWHIDHIIPISSFDLNDNKQVAQCFHYTNLRPLWAKANRAKFTAITEPQLKLLL